jgi:hypothetical protein
MKKLLVFEVANSRHRTLVYDRSVCEKTSKLKIIPSCRIALKMNV